MALNPAPRLSAPRLRWREASLTVWLIAALASPAAAQSGWIRTDVPPPAVHAEAEEAHGVAAQTRGHLPAHPLTAGPTGGGAYQSHPARMGELLRHRARLTVFLLRPRLGRDEDTSAPVTQPAASRLRLATAASRLDVWHARALCRLPGVGSRALMALDEASRVDDPELRAHVRCGDAAAAAPSARGSGLRLRDGLSDRGVGGMRAEPHRRRMADPSFA